MKCPACHRALRTRTVAGVTVDLCSGGCGGIWFDQGEFKKFDEPNEKAGEELLDIAHAPGGHVDRSQRYRCTKCPDSMLMRHFVSAKLAVVIDECPTCGGVWLDPGELRQIRSEYPSEEARRAAAQAYFKEVLGDRLDATRAETAAHLARWRRIANILMAPVPGT
jgi:uncharacterized protein